MKTINYNNYQVHYYYSHKPNSETLVFLHAAFMDHRLFARQFEAFKKDYSIIAIDMLGHGLTHPHKTNDKIDASVEHINEILKKENTDKVHLVGVSMGSLIAQYFVLQYPKKSQSLTILGGYDINADNKKINKAQRNEGMKWMFKALFSMKSFHKYVAKLSANKSASQSLIYEMLKCFKRKSFKYMPGMANVLEERTDYKIPCPALVLVGDNDLDLAKEAALQLHEKTPNSTFNQILNAGHCANLDQPDEFNKLLKSFLSSVD